MDKTALLKEKIADAEVVLIGIGEEFNERFDNISDHSQLLEGLSKVDENEELSWLVPFFEKIYLDEQQDSDILHAYRNLYELVKDKNYYIVTTCIDGLIEKVGFKEDKIVEPCGNYNKMQCSAKCSTKLHDSKDYVDHIKEALTKKKLDGLQRPVCPDCGKPLTFNNIVCENYVEEGYLPQWQKYTKWLTLTLNHRLCVLELGVGMNLPNIIRWPFEKVAFYNQKASFFRINESLYQITEDMGDKGIGIEGNACDFLKKEI